MSVELLITGDFCPINRVQSKLSSADFAPFVAKLEKLLPRSDLKITNLECPIVVQETPASKYGPHLHTSPMAVDLLEQLGFGLVTLANNHIMDHGAAGLESTLSYLEKKGIDTVGAGILQQEIDQTYLFTKEDHRIAIINVAENEFINTDGKPPGANSFDPIRLFKQVDEAKNLAETVILIIHGGNEDYALPSPRFKGTLRYCIDIGCDAVIAHHSHRFAGFEVYRNKPIFYGIGNFLFDLGANASRDWCLGAMVKLIIKSNLPVEFELIPYLQNYREDVGIRALSKQEELEFYETIRQKGEIIADDKRLGEHFMQFIAGVEKQYMHFLQPFTSKYFHKLYSMGLIPSFLRNKTKRLLYQNLIRCESHRDIVLKLLENENRNT